MTNRKPPRPDRLEVEKFFEFARRKDARPALKPLNFTFEPARRPDLLMPERPRADIRAADSAMREIRDYASKARELYRERRHNDRERRHNDRPLEAREYVRHQLALGMLDAPSQWTKKPEVRLGGPVDRMQRQAPAERSEDRHRPLFSLLRRHPRGS